MKLLQIIKYDELIDSLSINETENHQLRLQIFLLKPKQQDSALVTTKW
jgi:hypothetical protein